MTPKYQDDILSWHLIDIIDAIKIIIKISFNITLLLEILQQI